MSCRVVLYALCRVACVVSYCVHYVLCCVILCCVVCCLLLCCVVLCCVVLCCVVLCCVVLCCVVLCCVVLCCVVLCCVVLCCVVLCCVVLFLISVIGAIAVVLGQTQLPAACDLFKRPPDPPPPPPPPPTLIPTPRATPFNQCTQQNIVSFGLWCANLRSRLTYCSFMGMPCTQCARSAKFRMSANTRTLVLAPFHKFLVPYQGFFGFSSI